MSAADDAVAVFDMDTVYARVEGRAKPKARGDAADYEIISIDQSSSTSAFAKVRIALGDNDFTDYLTLLKVNGRWQIVGKTFTGKNRPGFDPL